jgi:hypothetical protein
LAKRLKDLPAGRQGKKRVRRVRYGKLRYQRTAKGFFGRARNETVFPAVQRIKNRKYPK